MCCHTSFHFFPIRSFQARMLAAAKAISINKWYPLSLQALSYPGKAPQHYCWRGRAWLAHPDNTERLQPSLLITLEPSWMGTPVSGSLDLRQDLELLPPSSSDPSILVPLEIPSPETSQRDATSSDPFQVAHEVLPLSDEVVLSFL